MENPKVSKSEKPEYNDDQLSAVDTKNTKEQNSNASSDTLYNSSTEQEMGTQDIDLENCSINDDMSEQIYSFPRPGDNNYIAQEESEIDVDHQIQSEELDYHVELPEPNDSNQITPEESDNYIEVPEPNQISYEELSKQLDICELDDNRILPFDNSDSQVGIYEYNDSSQIPVDESDGQIKEKPEDDNLNLLEESTDQLEVLEYENDSQIQTDKETDPMYIQVESEMIDSLQNETTQRLSNETYQHQGTRTEIVQTCKTKPFLGGYRHKLTGVEYHHSSTQTIPKSKPDKGIETFSRDTQTTKLNHQQQQTNKDVYTQVERSDVYLPSQSDKILVPRKPYITIDEIQQKLLDKVVLIQKYWRRWIARRFVRELREALQKKKKWEEDQKLMHQRMLDQALEDEYRRKLNPRRKTDFELLFSALDQWRNEQVETIERTKSGAERKAALCDVTDMEMDYIAIINCQRQAANVINRQHNNQKFLQKVAAPKRWIGKKGVVEVDTVGTLKAGELRDMNYNLSLHHLTRDERMAVLLSLKHTIKEQDCQLTRELTTLVDRELDLLVRGTDKKYLTGLRQCIMDLFWQYARQPAFNPEVALLQKLSSAPANVPQRLAHCRYCDTHYLIPNEGSGDVARQILTWKCTRCRDLENEGWRRREGRVFLQMLKEVWDKERQSGSTTGLVFLLNEGEIRYLVEKIWKGKSALSGSTNLFDLVFLRWNKEYEWTPWNCILMNRQEARNHCALNSVSQHYSSTFIQQVQQKHIAAKSYFSSLPRLLPYLDFTSKDGSTSNIKMLLN
ncbi:IQ and ubiquitin-like domain-containing protein [Limulus polyphemus]|uniref:IQ and ubiquitin-like domain-containing protein n=1 Tax=Limulus polyphemus TaxID=6850 RepID=A0ABM1SYK2_LIMPO|nr:IQ and ubiquitin-like domain-containing protein [Limulus polyphemus]XP_022248709.1 IQ and ubiquitin-like domain-containing protein [Limulus polyphemus]